MKLKLLLQELSSCWDRRPFGHNKHGPKNWGGLCPLFGEGELSSGLTGYGRGRGLPAWQVSFWYVLPYGPNTPTSRARQTGHSVLQPNNFSMYRICLL